MGKQFTRKIEDFVCGHCGASVTGNGYTNHCPSCLYSRHVDVNPGDRAATCGGLMAPVSVEQKKGAYVLLHRCLVCGFERRNKCAPEDNQKTIIDIARSQTDHLMRTKS